MYDKINVSLFIYCNIDDLSLLSEVSIEIKMNNIYLKNYL
jgi:hypothetical protein